MNKKYHEKFKILDILAVTTQACEGIETLTWQDSSRENDVTTQACEGIETRLNGCTLSSKAVTTQACEGIETCQKRNELTKRR